TGKFTLTNLYHFTNVEGFLLKWEIKEDGKEVLSGAMNLPDCPAGVSVPLQLGELAPETVKPGRIYTLDFSVFLPMSTSWAPAGHEVATAQFLLPGAEDKRTFDLPKGSLDLEETDTEVKVSGAGFTAVIDKTSGALTQYLVGKTNWLEAPLQPNYWRAPTDNDRRGWKIYRDAGIWKTAAADAVIQGVRVQETSGYVQIEVQNNVLGGKVAQKTIYTVYRDGEIKIDYDFKKQGDYPELTRIGMQMAIPNAYNQISFLGRGPHENYIDRLLSAEIGRYEMGIDRFFENYIMPQECSNRTGVRWMAFTSERGNGLLVQARDSLSMSAWPYSMEDLEVATHTYQLPKRNFLTVNIDHQLLGVGGDNTWSKGAKAHPEFRLTKDRYRYGFVLRPFDKQQDLEDWLTQPVPKLK
ncbi:MAG: DUF4981 domain-containing protein, partial [Mameliella sp.]|nr:DUF4981 domain-containing protein [Phaeodactylibacter sp.]